MQSLSMSKPRRKYFDLPDFSDGPKLVVLHEKHGDYHFLIKNEEEMAAWAVSVVKERNNQGYYPDMADEPKKPFDESIIETLPETIKAVAVKEMETWKAQYAWYLKELDTAKTVEKIIKEKDGKEAWKFLLNRRDGEYEDLEIVRLYTFNEYEV